MKVKYSKDVDILMMELAPREPIAFAQKRGSVIVHFNKQRQPVALELLDATKILRQTHRALPRDVEKAILVA